MKRDVRELQEIIGNAIRKETDLGDDAAYDVGFHMTDWFSELEQLLTVLDAPTEFGSRQIYLAVLNFLVHAPEHVAEAALLMTERRVDYIFRPQGRNARSTTGLFGARKRGAKRVKMEPLVARAARPGTTITSKPKNSGREKTGSSRNTPKRSGSRKTVPGGRGNPRSTR